MERREHSEESSKREEVKSWYREYWKVGGNLRGKKTQQDVSCIHLNYKSNLLLHETDTWMK